MFMIASAPTASFVSGSYLTLDSRVLYQGLLCKQTNMANLVGNSIALLFGPDQYQVAPPRQRSVSPCLLFAISKKFSVWWHAKKEYKWHSHAKKGKRRRKAIKRLTTVYYSAPPIITRASIAGIIIVRPFLQQRRQSHDLPI